MEKEPLLAWFSGTCRCFLVAGGCLAVELLFAAWGVPLPSALLVGLYFGVTLGPRAGLGWGLVTGIAAAAVLGRHDFLALAALVPVLLTAEHWREHGDRAGWPWRICGGGLAGFLGTAGLLLGNLQVREGLWLRPPRLLLVDLLLGTVLAAALFPLLVWLVDLLAEQAELSRFGVRARDEQRQTSTWQGVVP